MIIIGIDPGSLLTGFGIIKTSPAQIKRIYSGVIVLKNFTKISDRLEKIYNELFDIIKQYKPEHFAIETAFYGKNVQSALKIGYARGVAILAASHSGLVINEYSPREIKKSIVGNGAASKKQVLFMVKNLLNISNLKLKPDESDALATALCHCFKLKNTISYKNNWKDYLNAFPDKIIG